MRTLMVCALAAVLVACGGSGDGKLHPAPRTEVSWSVSADGNDVACDGASVRQDYTNTGVHVVFCTWPCGTYEDVDGDVVTMELVKEPGGWHVFAMDSYRWPGLCSAG